MDRKDYVVFGINEGTDFKFLQGVEAYYRETVEANRAPELAQKFFGIIGDPKLIEDSFQERYEAADSQQQRELGVAYNYAMINLFFRGGHEDFARQRIKLLVEKDAYCREVESALDKIETSLIDICSENQAWLTPKELDQVVFKKYVPKSDGLAFKQKQRSDILVTAFYDSISGRKVVQDKTATAFGHFNLDVNKLRFQFSGTRRRLEKVIAEQLEEVGVKNHWVIRTRTPEKDLPDIAHYVLLRYFTERYGKALHTLAPGIGGDSHEFISEKDESSE